MIHTFIYSTCDKCLPLKNDSSDGKKYKYIRDQEPELQDTI